MCIIEPIEAIQQQDETMKAIYKGYVSTDKNAVFSVDHKYNGVVISEKHFELKDGINADGYVIGEQYEIDGLTK